MPLACRAARAGCCASSACSTIEDLQWKIAGINHQGWLLEITDGGKDLYPEIKRARPPMNKAARNESRRRSTGTWSA